MIDCRVGGIHFFWHMEEYYIKSLRTTAVNLRLLFVLWTHPSISFYSTCYSQSIWTQKTVAIINSYSLEKVTLFSKWNDNTHLMISISNFQKNFKKSSQNMSCLLSRLGHLYYWHTSVEVIIQWLQKSEWNKPESKTTPKDIWKKERKTEDIKVNGYGKIWPKWDCW